MTLKNTSAFLTSIANNQLVQFTNSVYSEVDIFTAAAADSVIRKIVVTSTDTATKLLNLYAYDGANDFLIGSFTIPITAGTDGVTPAIDLLSCSVNANSFPLDLQGNRYISLKTGWKLRASVAQPTTAKLINLFVQGADYTVLS